jgi:hypothetical protein
MNRPLTNLGIGYAARQLVAACSHVRFPPIAAIRVERPQPSIAVFAIDQVEGLNDGLHV